MSRQYFGTDGIRGCVGESVVNAEFMLKLGWAIGTVLCRDHEAATVLIGRDTRISGSVLQASLQAGLAASGVNVKTLGIIPTPAVAYLTQSLRAHAGIVISASHNLYQDNGIKIFNADGIKLSDALELEIEALLQRPMQMVASEQLGVVHRLRDARARYIEFCKSIFPNQLSLEGLKLVVDCANGACFKIAPAVFKELGATVVTIGCKPSGLNINEECGATKPQALQAAVIAEDAHLGIALDGDGDRLILVDHCGELVDGDEILCILARETATGIRSKTGVVGTVMSNLGLEQALNEMSITFERAAVGDRYVLEKLIENGWSLGGEASGHIVDLDYTTTGDGVITALQVLRVMRMQGESLSELRKVMTKRPQVLINVASKDHTILQESVIQAAIQKAESKLGARGRLLIRPSGTEPVIRVMVEGNDAMEVQAVAEHLAGVIEGEQGVNTPLAFEEDGCS